MPVHHQPKIEFNTKYSNRIFSILNDISPCSSRFIGGCVRDALLERVSDDYDIATILTPEEISEILKKNNIKVIPTGIKYGTVTAYIEDEQFEITTLRKEIAYNGRFPEVAFTDSFELDASRRDFTINALSYCPYKDILYDYFGGVSDLGIYKIRFIGDALLRIVEDPLRILRFFRFNCYYGNKDHIDTAGLKACQQQKQLVHSLSKERIITELNKIVVHPNSYHFLKVMFDIGLLSLIIPIDRFNEQLIKNVFFFAKELNFKIDISTIYTLIFCDDISSQIANLLSLKFTKKTAAQIIKFISFLQNNNQINQYSLRSWWLKEEFKQLLILALSTNKIDLNVAKIFLAEHKMKEIPIFPVDGNDLAHLSQGIAIGETLAKLKELWIMSDFTLTKSELMTNIQK